MQQNELPKELPPLEVLLSLENRLAALVQLLQITTNSHKVVHPDEILVVIESHPKWKLVGSPMINFKDTLVESGLKPEYVNNKGQGPYFEITPNSKISGAVWEELLIYLPDNIGAILAWDNPKNHVIHPSQFHGPSHPKTGEPFRLAKDPILGQLSEFADPTHARLVKSTRLFKKEFEWINISKLLNENQEVYTSQKTLEILLVTQNEKIEVFQFNASNNKLVQFAPTSTKEGRYLARFNNHKIQCFELLKIPCIETGPRKKANT